MKTGKKLNGVRTDGTQSMIGKEIGLIDRTGREMDKKSEILNGT
jgi:hypothetical protein